MGGLLAGTSAVTAVPSDLVIETARAAAAFSSGTLNTPAARAPAPVAAPVPTGRRTPPVLHPVGPDGTFKIPVPRVDYVNLHAMPPTGSPFRQAVEQVDMRRHLWVAVVTIGFASCSSSEEIGHVFPASGKALLDDKPADGIVLTFLPVDLLPDGTTPEMIKARAEADGSYKPITYSRLAYSPRPGIPVGEYVVIIEREVDPPDGSGLSNRPKDSSLPEYYSDPKKTPLRATITGPTELPTFELTTKPK